MADLVAYTQAQNMQEEVVEEIVETYVSFQRKKRARRAAESGLKMWPLLLGPF